MPMPSLYNICLQRVYDLLKTEMWKTCPSNPFSYLPNHMVDDLMTITQAHFKIDPPTVADMFLPLTSGKITLLDLTPFNLTRERDVCVNVMRANSFMSVQVLIWYSQDSSSMSLVQVFICLCPNLEEFYSILRPNFKIFRMCEKLRILKFCPTRGMLRSDCALGFPVDYNELSSMKNLEVLYLPNASASRVAKVLQHCPQLISLGLVDSLDGLVKIHEDRLEKDLGHLGHFRLRRCVWGKNIEDKLLEFRKKLYVPEGFHTFVSMYRLQYPEKVAAAVSLCPLVEELVICTINSDSLKELKKLKNLTLLSINFRYCDDDYLPNFTELLKVIGHQLQHLSVICSSPLPVDIIYNHCPILETLDIDGYVTKSKPVPISLNVFLKRLRITAGDAKSLRLFLSNCKCLEEISLNDVLSLDDNLLFQILALNPMRELKVLGILNSSLSRKGFQMILEKGICLERVSFSAFGEEVSCMVKTLIEELELNYVDFNQIEKERVFHYMLDVSRF
ncbi:uncharacterized protein LOC129957208 [Argiope bruennichi]|uniref:uncharacterized protein LOC129957208 n=1 Tax=Argiope bruennichi TaxID=94029 RepID=UPI002494E01E|nr:uncharacterized protein LOC129957208 [Argiope bruennichi]XP_055925406.1 uncharacterized protein LOC129957208 [Argiope bruennichi]